MKLVKYEPNMADEQEWLEDEPSKSLCEAVILISDGAILSNDAIKTIRHFRYYRNARDGLVLFSDSVAALVDTGSPDEMIEAAEREADAVLNCMPDFRPYNMDDGCGLLHMTNANVYAFRSNEIDTGALGPALEARQECLEACEERKIVAVVYCDAEDYKLPQ